MPGHYIDCRTVKYTLKQTLTNLSTSVVTKLWPYTNELKYNYLYGEIIDKLTI